MRHVLGIVFIILVFGAACEQNGGSKSPYSATYNKPQFEERPLSPEEVLQHQKEAEERTKNERNCALSNHIIYFRDDRAHSLCYAWMWQSSRLAGNVDSALGGPGLTWVPCSDDVTPLICNRMPTP